MSYRVIQLMKEPEDFKNVVITEEFKTSYKFLQWCYFNVYAEDVNKDGTTKRVILEKMGPFKFNYINKVLDYTVSDYQIELYSMCFHSKSGGYLYLTYYIIFEMDSKDTIINNKFLWRSFNLKVDEDNYINIVNIIDTQYIEEVLCSGREAPSTTATTVSAIEVYNMGNFSQNFISANITDIYYYIEDDEYKNNEIYLDSVLTSMKNATSADY